MELHSDLCGFMARDSVLMRPVELAAYATDASLYRITPQAVVRPRDLEEVRSLLAYAKRTKVPLTFRAAGTSLSGQALGSGIIVDCSRFWRALEILDGGRKVKVGPGVVAGFVNRRLAPFGFKLGPDPASIDACMIGGIVANNSSGMCCGVEKNAYRTLESLVFLLPSGSRIDSSVPDASAQLHGLEPRIWTGIAELRDRVRGNTALADRIRKKYRLKNTMGYSLNSFLDFDDPLEILWHLMVGSEGTLGFLLEAVFATIPDLPHKSTGLLFFEDVRAACASIAALRETEAAALELMDRAALRSVEGKPGVPEFVSTLPPAAAALLVEHQAADATILAGLVERLDSALVLLRPMRRTAMTRDPAQQMSLWAVRKGIIPSVGGVRRRGTTLVTEDVVFPVEALADGVLGLQELFRKHRYDDSVIFGHAKDGNLHFLLAQGTNDPREVDQFSHFLDDLAEFVVGRHDGALKAEHGTGRNMAPFLEREWGPDACLIMRELKQLVDPDGILNPGVILNDDSKAHIANLKTIPAVGEEADRCIECGFCEPKCPSRDLTVTPRQRILIWRELARLRQADRMAEARVLEEQAIYPVVETCATDSLCATACPVAIDTGRLVKQLRHQGHGAISETIAAWLAGEFAVTAVLARSALRIGHCLAAIVGGGTLERLSCVARALGLPAWSADLPRAAGALPMTSREGACAVYAPSCITRVFAPAPGKPSLAETIVAVTARAGTPVWIPPDVADICCGMPFSSKGYKTAQVCCADRSIERLWSWSGGGKLTVILDTSPCAWTLRTCREELSAGNRKAFDALQIVDSIEFARDVVLPRLAVRRKKRSIALHPVCSLVKMNLAAALHEVGSRCSEEVFIPFTSGCCGFAGDRGFLHPELTESATHLQALEIRGRTCDGHFSSSRTCEIGMTRATGQSWNSFWALLDEVSR